jgi:hypothetical protein
VITKFVYAAVAAALLAPMPVLAADLGPPPPGDYGAGSYEDYAPEQFVERPVVVELPVVVERPIIIERRVVERPLIVEKRHVFVERPVRYFYGRPHGGWYHRKHFDHDYGKDFDYGYGKHFDDEDSDFRHRGYGRPY